jgi:hypothetical protein
MRSYALPAVVVMATACGGAIAAPAALEPPAERVTSLAPPAFGFHAGESMAFEVSIGGLTAGEAVLAVGAPGADEGRRLVAVRSRVATVGAAALLRHVVDEATTVLDVESRRAVQLDTDVEYGDNRYGATARFDGSAVDVQWWRKGSANKGSVHFDFKDEIPHDAHSAMAEIREWRAPAGSRRTVWVVGGRRLWRTDLTIGPRMSIGTKLGNRPVIRLDGVAYRARGDLRVDATKKPRRFTVWVSDDADRVPLRVSASTELGDVIIELVDYRRP